MPAIQPKAAIFDDAFTERKHSVSTSAITITRSASSHTVLASIQFTNTEPCDLLAFASIDVRQSGVIARWVRTWLWITLDDMEIGNGMHTIGSFGPDLEPIFTYSAHGALGARKDVAPGAHTVQLRARADVSSGSPTVQAVVREFQTIEFYK